MFKTLIEIMSGKKAWPWIAKLRLACFKLSVVKRDIKLGLVLIWFEFGTFSGGLGWGWLSNPENKANLA